VEDICRKEEPEFREIEAGRFAACHFAERELAASAVSTNGTDKQH
jgi:hypothetical protein